MKPAKSLQFQVEKNKFINHAIEEIPEEQLTLAADEIKVKIDLFSFTSNNITYAVSGAIIRYWEFFPPVGKQTEGWGVIPVWGFADVVESKADGIPVGDRIFGYFPPASHLKMKAGHITAKRFIDVTEHRSTLPPTYNLYRRVLSEPNYDQKLDRDRALFYPLYITSFCLWDSLKENSWFGAEQIIILSASSKTSIGMAYGLYSDNTAPKAIGITSERNRDAVVKLGLYTEVYTYEQLADVDRKTPSVIVDMSGNNAVLVDLHKRLGDLMKFTFKVGLTHWKESNPNEGIIRERSKFFFAPGHIQKRIEDWGASEFDQKTSQFIVDAVATTKTWLQYKTLDGLADLAEVYPTVCNGTLAADQGLIVSM